MLGKNNKSNIELKNLVSKDAISTFQQDGVVFLRDLFGPWVDGVRQAIEQNKANPSWRERTY
ncbi:MAG: phytanoyl-CoA dioxygenase, partial [SAR324 cluster bacterium]|nr:phytanoyl-CoA dioxygenase [SAR324 cluster bacterium]